jgi:glycosyltransferase involved in cell wall biosynthesis
VHILVVNYSFRPIGGAEIYVRSNIDALGRLGCRITAVSADPDPPPLPEWVRWIRNPDLFSTSLTRISRAYRGAAELARVLDQDPPEVALLHLFDALPGMRLLEARVPTIRFVHTAWPYCPAGSRWLPRSNRPCGIGIGLRCLAVDRREHCLVTLTGERFGLKNAIRRLVDMELQRGFLRSATIVAANSTYTERELQAFAGPLPNIQILPPPVPGPQLPSRDPVPHRVLVVGRLTPFKGVQDAIRAISSIPDATLRIAGDGPYRPVLEALVDELHLRSRVTFLGWVDHSIVEAEMHAAQVIAFPSSWPETFGQVGVQAGFCERPVVAYDAGGVRDWLSEETGVLVPVGDWRALADGLAALLADPERCRALGARGRRAAERFGMGPFAARMEHAIHYAIEAWRLTRS